MKSVFIKIFNVKNIGHHFYSKYLFDITRIGIHEAINPMLNTVTNTSIISKNIIFTGYVVITKVPMPYSFTMPNCI